jgi:acyl-CoA thioesterase-1
MFHFAGGDAFVCGLVVYAACHLALLRTVSPLWRRWLIIVGSLGLLWASVVLPPIPWVLMSAFIAVQVTWFVGGWRKRRTAQSAEVTARPNDARYRIALATIAMTAVVCEAFGFFFQQPAGPIRTLCVVGDSVTAGLNDGEDTWPRKLARQVNCRVLDASQPGATLKSARHQVELLNERAGDLLILEIGGNDLLEGLMLEQFEQHLDQLLKTAVRPKRTVVMFELPLPPLSTRYGEIQRRLASRHQIRLIPRRHFIGVLTATGSTVDGIHLSQRGQDRLRLIVLELLPLTEGPGGTYEHLDP